MKKHGEVGLAYMNKFSLMKLQNDSNYVNRRYFKI